MQKSSVIGDEFVLWFWEGTWQRREVTVVGMVVDVPCFGGTHFIGPTDNLYRFGRKIEFQMEGVWVY